jgi:AcrR family transcriptional regulator
VAKKRLTGAERRVQLMEVGRAVFAANGYEATSIEEVAQRAGVSKPIVYEHFGAKEGLYAAIVDREMDNLVTRVSEVIARGSPRERFEAAVLAFMTYAKEEPAGFAVLTRDSPNGAARRGLTRVIDDLAQRVGDIFQSEFERAGYTPKVAPIYANALVGMVTQVGQWWAAEGRSFSIDHVARHVAALGWMGLRHLPKDPVSPGGKPGTKRRA